MNAPPSHQKSSGKMSVVQASQLETAKLDDNAYRVLVTGFGPFAHYEENPSWLAVRPLHNKVLTFEPPPDATLAIDAGAATAAGVDVHMRDVDESDVDEPEPEPAPKPRQIHITVCKVPVVYEAVLSIVPGFHSRPPVLPEHDEPLSPSLPPDEDGYDLCFHVGVAGRGPLRVERIGHKKGYNMKDATGKLAPIVPVTISTEEDGPSGDPQQSAIHKQQKELAALKQNPFIPTTPPTIHVGGDPEPEPVEPMEITPPTRGLGKGYEAFDDEIPTDIDALKLVHFLKDTGFQDIYTSMDAGHYLCDYIYYCSLAEAKRANRNAAGRVTRSIFMHCPPVNQPHSTREVTDAIMKAVIWICTGLQTGEALLHVPPVPNSIFSPAKSK